jgi:hypothetical protein
MPKIPEILNSQIIKIEMNILFFAIIRVLKLIQKQLSHKVNKREYIKPI